MFLKIKRQKIVVKKYNNKMQARFIGHIEENVNLTHRFVKMLMKVKCQRYTVINLYETSLLFKIQP